MRQPLERLIEGFWNDGTVRIETRSSTARPTTHEHWQLEAFRLSEKLNRLAETMQLTKLVETPPGDDLPDLQLREPKNSPSRSCDASTGWLRAGD
jgi:hypothetical protein